ncbi:hypothetical protein N665_6597s0001 [Sinapis alba]|nr:hypothetical protein N665_6597s0001 [Sinapis alba]
MGNGMFMFQFDLESDLLSVLEKRPYHYARWMIILQRWEPTISPSFPSLIPFWIKVQGIPLHLWTEGTIKSIGEDIGIFESLEISSTAIRMRVHINGRLPLIMASTIEFSNGDEIKANLVYEKLERHCSTCFRLDHEVRDCLEAKAQKKAQAAMEEQRRSLSQPNQNRNDQDGVPSHNRERTFQFTATKSKNEYNPPSHRHEYRRKYQNQDTESRRQAVGGRRDSTWERYPPPTRARNHQRESYNRDATVRFPHRVSSRERTSGISSRSVYREVHRHRNESVKEYSNASKVDQSSPARGVPLRDAQNPVPPVMLEEAIEEIRDVMIQYTNCADPTESAARKERFRKAVEAGELEETALHMVRTSMENAPLTVSPPVVSQERIPALLRLGNPASEKSPTPLEKSPAISHGRLNASQRNASVGQEEQGAEPAPLGNPLTIFQERVPAIQRLGPVFQEEDIIAPVLKRKPGRPPGKKKQQPSSPVLIGACSRKRKVQQAKPPPCRKRLTAEAEPSARKSKKTRQRGTSMAGPADSANQLSDNQPLCNFIPARKRMDFQVPSTLAP